MMSQQHKSLPFKTLRIQMSKFDPERLDAVGFTRISRGWRAR